MYFFTAYQLLRGLSRLHHTTANNFTWRHSLRNRSNSYLFAHGSKLCDDKETTRQFIDRRKLIDYLIHDRTVNLGSNTAERKEMIGGVIALKNAALLRRVILQSVFKTTTKESLTRDSVDCEARIANILPIRHVGYQP